MHILIFIFIAVLLFVIYIISSKEEKRVKSKYEPRGKLEEYVTSEKERRRHQRFNTTLDVNYKLLKSQKINLPTSTKNISESGIGILVYELLPKDAVLEIEISIPDTKEPLTIKGKVAWCEAIKQPDKDGRRSFLTGIEFLQTEKEQKAKLIEYINAHLLAKTDQKIS